MKRIFLFVVVLFALGAVSAQAQVFRQSPEESLRAAAYPADPLGRVIDGNMQLADGCVGPGVFWVPRLGYCLRFNRFYGSYGLERHGYWVGYYDQYRRPFRQPVMRPLADAVVGAATVGAITGSVKAAGWTGLIVYGTERVVGAVIDHRRHRDRDDDDDVDRDDHRRSDYEMAHGVPVGYQQPTPSLPVPPEPALEPIPQPQIISRELPPSAPQPTGAANYPGQVSGTTVRLHNRSRHIADIYLRGEGTETVIGRLAPGTMMRGSLPAPGQWYEAIAIVYGATDGKASVTSETLEVRPLSGVGWEFQSRSTP